MPGHANIPQALCLHPSREQCKTEEDHFDVFLCYREGGSDEALAVRLRDKLEACDIKTGGSEKRRVRVFLKNGSAPPAAKVQVANALFGSTVILLLVSCETFADIDKLHADSPTTHWLVQLLWKYEMALEMFDAGQHTVMPLLIGRKHERHGRNEFETFDVSEQHKEFWHLQKMTDLRVKSIVKNALDGLRCNTQCRERLHDEMLTYDFSIPSIIRGRSLKQSIMAFSSADTFTPWKFEGIEDDAIAKVCNDLTVLVDNTNKKRTRDTCCLDNEDRSLVGVSSTSSVDEGPGSKRQKSVCTSAEDCNELIDFLKTEGLPLIAAKFCYLMRMQKLIDFMNLEEEDWEEKDLSFLRNWEKKKLIRLVAGCTAHSLSGNEGQSDVPIISETPTQRSTYTCEKKDSDNEVAVAVKNLGNLDDLVSHLRLFIGELMGGDGKKGQRHMSFCMILWIVFLKDARYNDGPHVRNAERWLEKVCKEKKIGEEEMAREVQSHIGQNVVAHRNRELMRQVKEKMKEFEQRPCVTSIAIIDHMVKNLLKNDTIRLKDWQDNVVKSWYTSDETVKDFLVRSNDFLRVSIGDANLLLEGFEIQSYIAFMQMPRLAACLLFGYLETFKLESSSSVGAAGGRGGCDTLLHGFCTFASSAGQLFNLSGADMPARSALTTVTQGLRCLSRLRASEWETLGPVMTARQLVQDLNVPPHESIAMDRKVWEIVDFSASATYIYVKQTNTRIDQRIYKVVPLVCERDI